MPTYRITDPTTGKVLRVTGDSPPTEQELQQLFASNAPATRPSAGDFWGHMAEARGDVSDVGLRSQLAGEQNNVVGRAVDAWTQGGPVSMTRGAARMARGEVAGGARDVLRGTAVTASPAVLPALATAPVATAGALVGGAALGVPVSRGVEWAGTQMGLSPDQAGLAGDVAGIGAGAVGARLGSGTAAYVGDKVTRQLPRRMYAQIFKTEPEAFAQSWRAKAAGDGAQPTLADKALTEGLSGSVDEMGLAVARTLPELEQGLQRAAKRAVLVVSDKPKYIALLDQIASKVGDGFQAPVSQEAAALKAVLQETAHTPQLRADVLLRLRRFLDSQLNPSVHDSEAPLRGMGGEIKAAADQARATLHRNDAIDGILSRYESYIQFADALAAHAKKTENGALFGLMDGVLSARGPEGVAAAVMRRGLSGPSALTAGARGFRALRGAMQPLPSHVPDVLGAVPSLTRPAGRPAQ